MALPTRLKNIKYGKEFEKLPLRKLFVVSFFMSIVTIIIGLITKSFLPPEIPLFYGLPQTQEQLTSSTLIILPSVTSILITIINFILSIKIQDNHLKKTLAFASVLVSLLAIITTYKIIFLVGSL